MGLGGDLVLDGDSGELGGPGSFIFDSALDVADEFGLAPEEARVVVVVAVCASLLGEAVHVELADV